MFDVHPTGVKANSTKPPDIYSFDEDSSDALSPPQPASQQSPSSTSASPKESGGPEATSVSSNLKSPPQVHQYLEPKHVIKHKVSMSADKLGFLTSDLIWQS